MYTDFVKYNVYRFLPKNQIVLKLANSLNIFENTADFGVYGTQFFGIIDEGRLCFGLSVCV